MADLAGGGNNALAIRAGGTVEACGADDYGQASGVATWSGITDVAVGQRVSLGIRSDGRVEICGVQFSTVHEDVRGWTNIVAIDAGGSGLHVIAAQEDGTPLATGDDEAGQVSGVSSWATDIIAVAAGQQNSYGLRSGGTVEACGNDTYNQVSGVSGWTGIEAIASGFRHVVGLKDDGTVVAAGWDDDGQVSGVSGWTDIVAVAAGVEHTIGLKSDGTVVACGGDSYGQVSGVSSWTGITDIAAGFYFTFGKADLGNWYACGADSNNEVSCIQGWNLTDYRFTPLQASLATSAHQITTPNFLLMPVAPLALLPGDSRLGLGFNIPDGESAQLGVIPTYLVGLTLEALRGRSAVDGEDPGLEAACPLARGMSSLQGVEPWYYWLPDVVASRVVYRLVLTGSADGLEDVSLPVESIRLRRQEDQQAYLETMLPMLDEIAAKVADRSSGQLVVSRGSATAQGITWQEIVRTDLEEIETLRNSRIRLAGHADELTGVARQISLEAWYRNLDQGKARYRSSVDPFTRPGDQVEIDDQTVTVGEMSYFVMTSQEQMEIVEA